MNTIEERACAYRQSIVDMDIFDTALWWAPQHTDMFVHQDNWEKQLERHAQYGIKGGLVTSHTAANYDPYVGNDELPSLLKGHDNLYGCMVVTPDMFFEKGKGEDYLKRMKDQRVVAARMYPGKYMHSTQEYAIGSLCTALEQVGLPLLVWHIDTGWDAMDRICATHPALNVVMESMDRKLLYHARDYISLLKKHSNFYMETHNLVLFDEYQTLDRLVGCEHLLYGSYYPYMTPDFSLYPIYASDVPTACKQAIFAGNARKLFGV
ncbi:MAG: amidohydrolase family protein [Clostridia bacterium]